MVAQNDTGGGAAVAVVLLILIGIAFCFIPTIVGVIRKVPNLGSIIVINIFLGWSLIGWVVALAMAARTVPASGTQVIIQQPPAPPQGPQQPGPMPPPPAQGARTTFRPRLAVCALVVLGIVPAGMSRSLGAGR